MNGFGARPIALSTGGNPLALTAELGVVAVAANSIRDLDDHEKERRRVRAASPRRSMESEFRAVLTDAVSRPDESVSLFRALHDGFGAMGGMDLDLPPRTEPPRWADFSL